MKSNNNNITSADIKDVATGLSMRVSEPEVSEVLKRFDFESEQDKGATWNLVVEKILDNVVSERED